MPATPTLDPPDAEALFGLAFVEAIRRLVQDEVRRALRDSQDSRRRALGLADVVAATGLSRSTVQRLVARGVVKSVRVGRRVVIAVDEVERLLATGVDR